MKSHRWDPSQRTSDPGLPAIRNSSKTLAWITQCPLQRQEHLSAIVPPNENAELSSDSSGHFCILARSIAYVSELFIRLLWGLDWNAIPLGPTVESAAHKGTVESRPLSGCEPRETRVPLCLAAWRQPHLRGIHYIVKSIREHHHSIPSRTRERSTYTGACRLCMAKGDSNIVSALGARLGAAIWDPRKERVFPVDHTDT